MSTTRFSPESLPAAGKSSEKLTLPFLQSKMNSDPGGYLTDIQLIIRLIESSLDLFRRHSALNPSSDHAIAHELGDLSMFLAHVSPFYSSELDVFPNQITELLRQDGRMLLSSLSCHLARALILIINRQPNQRDVTELLAATVQAYHDMVPLDAVEPLFRQIVYQFVHDRSCIEIFPSLLFKKDSGRPVDPKARHKAFGEVSVANDVPGLELLQEDCSIHSSSDDDVDTYAGENNEDDEQNTVVENEDDEAVLEEEYEGEGDDVEEDESHDLNGIVEGGGSGDGDGDGDEDEDDVDTDNDDNIDDNDDGDDEDSTDDGDDMDEEKGEKTMARKRKFADYVGQLNAAETSLCDPKKLAGPKMYVVPSYISDGILSNEDFQHIKELKAKKEAKMALIQQGPLKKCAGAKSTGFKIPSSEELSAKQVDPAMFEVKIKRKHGKEERLALVRAGREDRGKYQARAAVKKKKTGGLSNRQKENKKVMPCAAKKAIVARRQQQKKNKKGRSGKQFRGRKAWK